jgi:surface protein
MFNSATAFDQPIASWNVLRVNAAGWATTWTSAGLSSCNQGAMYRAWGATFQGVWPAYASYACVVGSLCSTCITQGNIRAAVTAWIGGDATTYGNIAEWNTAAVSNMDMLFYDKTTFNADISKWNVASVSTMASTFFDTKGFDREIGAWNTASVSNMDSTFYGADVFNQNIESWNVASVSNMYYTFGLASAFNRDIGSWNTASVESMSYMLWSATAFNRDIGSWNTASVSNMYWAFYKAAAFNQNIGRWNVRRVTSLSYAFDLAAALSDCNKRAIYSAWGTTLQTEYPTWSSLSGCTRCENVRVVARGMREGRVCMRTGGEWDARAHEMRW